MLSSFQHSTWVAHPRVVAFDFDRTLTRTDTTRLLVLALLRSRPLRAITVAPFVVRFLTHRISVQEFKMALIGRLIRGCSVDRVASAAVHRFAASAQKLLRQDIMGRLREHVAKGDMVIVATASPTFAVKALFASEGIHVIGTELEIVNGRYTGQCLGNCYGEEKANHVGAFLQPLGLAGLECAYTDHHSDAPVLALARQGVLVYPDAQTKQILAKRNYTIIE